MKVLIAGAGPAGLSLAVLMAEADRSHEITVLERNAMDQTPGWGVTLRDHALFFLGLDKRVSALALGGRAFRFRGELTVDLPNPPGVKLVTISRNALISALVDNCRECGVKLSFGVDVTSLPESELLRFDLVVGADGSNSALRRRYAEVFQPTVTFGSNRYAWLGAAVPFPKLTILLRDQHPALLVWAYNFTSELSTFIVECHEETWQRMAFAKKSSEETSRAIANAFAVDLGGAPILPGRSIQWQRYQLLSCAKVQHRNVVLLGDAAHTTHYSQGFGTMFAFDDAVALHTALKNASDIPQALSDYEAAQQPRTRGFQATSAASMHWSEDLLAHAVAGDESKVRELIAARWPNNEVTASPLGPPEKER